jgi:hypothetical protein
METNINRTDPTPVTIRKMLPGSGTADYRFNAVAMLPITASSSSTSTGWVNPEAGTVAAKVFVAFTVAGTGTIDVGLVSDGTAPGNSIIDGGTMVAGVLTGVSNNVGGTAGTVGGADGWVLVGPGGTGTNNSIALNHNEAATSTAVGAVLISYFLIGGE